MREAFQHQHCTIEPRESLLCSQLPIALGEMNDGSEQWARGGPVL